VEKIKIRGLAHGTSIFFSLWGLLVACKGVYDLFIGEPEANLYAPRPWEFVSREAWLRYSGFELVYGLACLGLALALWKYARFLPETIERRKREPEFQLFD